MKKAIFMTVLMVFGLAMFSGCATMTGETAGEKYRRLIDLYASLCDNS